MCFPKLPPEPPHSEHRAWMQWAEECNRLYEKHPYLDPRNSNMSKGISLQYIGYWDVLCVISNVVNVKILLTAILDSPLALTVYLFFFWFCAIGFIHIPILVYSSPQKQIVFALLYIAIACMWLWGLDNPNAPYLLQWHLH
ncbi:MAG: hypothetical protein LBB55_05255 [Zoogloeaceae bacterium]|nr:hypothetical protein [Zoogloeaceae bacterium]